MFKLQKLNVIKIVKTEQAKARLIANGFEEVIEKVEKPKKGKE